MGKIQESIECPLCSIPEREQTIYSDKLIYMVKTKEDKGHLKRIMVCTNRHTQEPTFEEKTHALCLLFNYMSMIMGDNPWYIVDSTYATIKYHFHIVACDNYGTDEELAQLANTEKVRFPLEM